MKCKTIGRIIMLIAITIALVLSLTACGMNKPMETDYCKEIKRQALAELELSDDTKSELYFLGETDCAWQDGVCEEYLLVIGEIGYTLGVRRKGDKIEFVDVEEQVEITQGHLSDLTGGGDNV